MNLISSSGPGAEAPGQIKKEYQFYSEEKREDYNCLINQVKNADDADLIDKMLPHRDKLLALINK